MKGMGREAELVKVEGQAGRGTSGMLNPGGFSATTAMLDVQSRWRGKASRHKGLTGLCGHRYWQDGKSGRNGKTTADLIRWNCCILRGLPGPELIMIVPMIWVEEAKS